MLRADSPDFRRWVRGLPDFPRGRDILVDGISCQTSWDEDGTVYYCALRESDSRRCFRCCDLFGPSLYVDGRALVSSMIGFDGKTGSDVRFDFEFDPPVVCSRSERDMIVCKPSSRC